MTTMKNIRASVLSYRLLPGTRVARNLFDRQQKLGDDCDSLNIDINGTLKPPYVYLDSLVLSWLYLLETVMYKVFQCHSRRGKIS